MKLFRCHHCNQTVFFENTHCERCGHRLGYDWRNHTLVTLESADEEKGWRWKSTGTDKREYIYCANAAHNACNWLVRAENAEIFCLACRLNQTIPDLTQSNYLAEWQQIETAKHRLLYSLLRLGLPVKNKTEEPEMGLAFEFLANTQNADGTVTPVTTGHDVGVITLNIVEADDAERERMRQNMHEAYRTLLGHFRHEIGHYYWMLLAKDTDWLTRFRELFGDERQDYGAALEAHYANGAPADWQATYVSAYASAHPWEDWAESWAHYLHITDTLETAFAFGIELDPRGTRNEQLKADVDFDPYHQQNFNLIFDTWLPVTFAMNSLNRSMGIPDLYPFITSTTAVAKMAFVHETIRQQDLQK